MRRIPPSPVRWPDARGRSPFGVRGKGHQQSSAGLLARSCVERAPTLIGRRQRRRRENLALPQGHPDTDRRHLTLDEETIALPPWLSAKAPAALPALLIVRPSDIADHEPRSLGAGNTREVALLRGTLAHRLLQSLPDIPAPRREKVAGEFLSRRGKTLSADQRAALVREVLLLVENKDFAELFKPGS